MDTLLIVRALHVLAIANRIGGVSIVTLVILPSLTRSVSTSGRLDLFELIEGRFADPSYWWMHAMVTIWASPASALPPSFPDIRRPHPAIFIRFHDPIAAALKGYLPDMTSTPNSAGRDWVNCLWSQARVGLTLVQ